MNIHEHSSKFFGMSWVVLLLLADVNKPDGKPISIVGVVPTTSPEPVTVEGGRAGPPTAATGAELTLPARPADGVHHSGR